MKDENVQKIRKTFVVITLVLVFATAGLLSITSQLKTITLNYFGDVKYIRTLASNVDSFLLQNKISVGENTLVTPSSKTQIVNGLEIKVYSQKEMAKLNIEDKKAQYIPVIVKIEEVIENIPFDEQKIDNSLVNRGSTKTIQDGIVGQKSTKFIVKYENNKEIYRAELSSTIISEAQNKVIEVGTKIALNVSRNSNIKPAQSVITDGGFKQYNIGLGLNEQKFAYNLCKQYGIDYELFLSMMYKESGYNKNALGGGNSYGLCQIHASNHSSLRRKLNITNFYDPYDNMTAGVYLLSQYFASARNVVSGDSVVAYALNSYNMGEGIYFRKCFSQGVLNRSYSNSIISIRNRLITQGGL